MSVTPECISEILDAIVGSTSPQADTYLDRKSQENIPAFQEVCKWISKRLDRANKAYDSKYASECETARKVMEAAGDLSYLWDLESGRCPWMKEEEVCHNVLEGLDSDSFRCSVCGALLALDDGYGNTIQDIEPVEYPQRPNFCPNCGAKVVR